MTYDSSKEDAFIVHTNCGQVKFVNRERLYVYEPSQNYLDLIKDMKKLNEPVEEQPEKRVHFEIKDEKTEENKTKVEPSNPPQSTEMCQVIPSVTENMMKYTKRQIKRAQKARVTSRTLGSLTVENFKNVLRQNLIKIVPSPSRMSRSPKTYSDRTLQH